MNSRFFLAILCFLIFFHLSPAHAADDPLPSYKKNPDIVWEVPVNEKLVALTFDDGPDPIYTTQILDVLRKYDAKATFFVVGFRVEKYQKIVRRQVVEKHELANHTYSHVHLRGRSEKYISEEIKKSEEVLYHYTGKYPSLFRPPFGYYNEKVVSAARKKGYTIVMWSWHQDTLDWQNPGVGRIVNKVLSNVQPGQIILFHDHGSGSRRQTVRALQEILPALKQRGYRFVTVSELLKFHPQYRYLNL